MSSKNFISKSLRTFSHKFQNYQFTYWFDEKYLEHFVEVIPDAFHNNVDFVDYELDIIKDFYLNFPLESIAFITPEQRDMISDVILVNVFNSISNMWYKAIGYTESPDIVNVSNLDYSLAA